MNYQTDQSKVRLGVIGLGGRGRGLLSDLLEMEDVEIPAVCEIYEDRLQMGVDQVVAAHRKKPDGYKDYMELLASDDIEGVIIPSTWTSHAEISISAMKAGKYAGHEAGGAS